MNNMHMGGGGGGMGKSRSLNSTTVDQKQSRATKVRVLRRMSKYLFSHPVMVLSALFLMLSSNLLALAGPKLSGKAIDAIEAGAGKVDLQTVGFYALLLVVLPPRRYQCEGYRRELYPLPRSCQARSQP